MTWRGCVVAWVTAATLVAGPSAAVLPTSVSMVQTDGVSESRWTQMAPTLAPSARLGHGMAYDSQSDRVILFGGETTPGSNVLNGETWAFDLNSDTWENRNPNQGPSARFAHAMAYDAKSDRVILFGGWTGTDQSNETWAYDQNTNAWTNKSPSASPPVAVFVDMAYDTESDQTILFGGGVNRDGGGLRAETWAYDFNSNTWTRMNPGASPPARGSHGMTYDANSDRVVLFGGRDSGADFGDTWAYNYNDDAWTQLSPPSAPSPRHAPAMTYDLGSNLVILFGGVTVTGGLSGSDETWTFDFNSDAWSQLEKGSGPSPRFGAVVAADTESDRIVLFGGSSGGAETWSLRLALSEPTPPWTLLAAGVGIGAIAVGGIFLLVQGRRRKRKGLP